MPQLKNAKKALRQSEKKAEFNQDIKQNIRFLMKRTRKLSEQKDAKAEETLRAAIKAIDKAAQKGIFKKNTAARKKSRLIKQSKILQAEKK